jgi:hypothetical protein
MAVTRAQIATALSTVPGVAGSEREPPTKASGQGWPVWRSSEATIVAGSCIVTRVDWYVFVVLPGGDVTAWAEAADPLATPIAEALAATSLTIERWEPYQLVLGPDRSIPALRYTAFD